MTRFKNKLLPLLLALVMVMTMLPMTALAAEIPEETTTVCTDENCAHEHTHEIPASDDISEPTSIEESPVVEELIEAETPEAPTPVDTPAVTEGTSETPEVDELPTVETPALENVETPEAPAETNAYSGHIGDSTVAWDLDPASGRLFITGSGGCDTFTSSDDQPWAAVRENIVAVYIDDCDDLTVDSIAYWFSGCTSLAYAEIPASVCEIGYHAFYDCRALHDVVLFHDAAVPVLIQGAFDTKHPLEWATDYDPRLHITVSSNSILDALCAYDWGADDCPLTASTAFYSAPITTFARTASVSTYAVGYCSNCGKTCSYSVAYEQWTSSIHCIRHWCSNCGYDQCGGANAGSHSYNNSGYCTYCGYYNSAYDNSSVCYHTSTYKSWSGCNWTKYCSNCGAYISSGTSHGSTYTSWSGCNWYDYCSDCGQLMDSGTSHSYNYGNWEYYNGSQHRRLYSCSSCGQGSYTYGNHFTSTRYAQYSTTQHSVSSYCSTCATNVSTSYASHSFSYGSWTSYNGTQHRRLKTCSTCGYSEYEYASHSLSYGSWSIHSDTQHQRTGSCSCRYSTTETGAHTDFDDNGYCDDCEYLMTRFSVTVPASLSLTVSEHGAVYAADNAAIVNNSTGAVAITGVTVSTANGWTLVPFRSNMAAAKVDSKQIGFSLNSAQSAVTGNSESLSLSGAWSIAKGASLPLTYDAVVSAMSQPVNEQVLTVVFVLDWAA